MVNKYTHNKIFFSVPNVLNSYYAGFIAADGCIQYYKGGMLLEFGVKATDTILLEQFKRDIEYTGKITQRITQRKGKSLHRSDMRISNAKNICDDLYTYYNITPKKSLTLLPPNLIDKEQIKAFIVGYIDGDGCIDTQKNRLRLKVLGTQSMLDWISKFFSDEYAIKPNVHTYSNVYCMYLTGNKALKILSDLESILIPKLDRKWNKVQCKTTNRAEHFYMTH